MCMVSRDGSPGGSARLPLLRGGWRQPDVDHAGHGPTAGLDERHAAAQLPCADTAQVQRYPGDAADLGSRCAERLHAPYPHGAHGRGHRQLVSGLDGARLQCPGDHGPAALDGEHPVQPQPDGAPRVRPGKPRGEPAKCGGQLGQALAGDGADRDGFQLTKAGACDRARGLPQRRPRVGEVGPGDHQHSVPDTEGVDRRQMVGGLGHPALVRCHHEHHRRHGAHTGQHVRYESFVPWHVDKRELIAGRKRRPRVAQVDRHAAAALGFPAVRLHPGERAHQHRLPVVHMTGGGDDVHRYSRSEAPSRAAAASTASATRSSSAGATVRRSSRSRPPSILPMTAGRSPRRTAAPDRRPTASDSGTDSAVLGSRTPGPPPPPTAASAGTTRQSTASVAYQPPGLGLGSCLDRLRGGRHGRADRRRRSGQRRHKGGKGQLVHPQRPGQRMAGEAGNGVGLAEQQARLRSAEQLVAAGRDQPGAGPQPGVGVGLAGEHRARPQQAGADVADHQHPQAGQFADAGRRREALDHVVGRVHLQDECRVGADRPLVVGERGPVGGAHLPDPGAGGLQQVRQPEPVAYLDQLAAADDDLASGGQGRGHQGQRGGVVVDHVHRPGRRDCPRESVNRTSAPAPAFSRGQVELHVRAARRGPHRVTRGGRQRRPAEVGVHDHARRVDHRGEGGSGRRQCGHRGVGDARRADGPGAGQFLCLGNRRLDQRPAQLLARRGQPGVGQHNVGSRYVTARVHNRDLNGRRPRQPFLAPQGRFRLGTTLAA